MYSPRRHDRGASRSLPPTRVRWDAGRAGHARQGAAPGSDFASSPSHCATAACVVSCRCGAEGLRHFLGAVGHQRLLTAGTLARLRGPRERNGGLPSGRSSEEPRAIRWVWRVRTRSTDWRPCSRCPSYGYSSARREAGRSSKCRKRVQRPLASPLTVPRSPGFLSRPDIR